jgi:hypothetical protein
MITFILATLVAFMCIWVISAVFFNERIENLHKHYRGIIMAQEEELRRLRTENGKGYNHE